MCWCRCIMLSCTRHLYIDISHGISIFRNFVRILISILEIFSKISNLVSKIQYHSTFAWHAIIIALKPAEKFSSKLYLRCREFKNDFMARCNIVQWSDSLIRWLKARWPILRFSTVLPEIPLWFKIGLTITSGRPALFLLSRELAVSWTNSSML